MDIQLGEIDKSDITETDKGQKENLFFITIQQSQSGEIHFSANLGNLDVFAAGLPQQKKYFVQIKNIILGDIIKTASDVLAQGKGANSVSGFSDDTATNPGKGEKCRFGEER